MRKRMTVGIDETWKREEQKRTAALEKRERRTNTEGSKKRKRVFSVMKPKMRKFMKYPCDQCEYAGSKTAL